MGDIAIGDKGRTMHFAALNAAQDLLADLAADLDDVRSILVPGGSAEMLDELSGLHPDAEIHWIPTDIRVAFVGNPNVVVHNDPGSLEIAAGSIDLAVLEITGDRDLSRRWIAMVREVARPGGVFLISGANDAGIKSVIADAGEAIGPSVIEDFRRSNRVAHVAFPPVMPSPPEWAQQNGIAPGTWSRFSVQEGGIDLMLESLPGVFSAERLDVGTKLLLDHLEVDEGDEVLDVGCGTGVIGVVAARRGAESVTMSDVNLIAVSVARRNAGLIEVPVRVLAGDVYSAIGDEYFDLIVSNPPFHQGKVIDYDMPQRLIASAARHLSPGGRLVIVANAFLPYDRLMAEHFDDVEVLAATRQYRVLSASS